MARKNIFELLKTRWDLKEELLRLNRLFDEIDVLSADSISYTLKDFVETFCFEDWKNRSRYIDVDDYLETLNFDELFMRAPKDIESFLTVMEIMYNFFYMAYKKIEENEKYKYYTQFITFKKNMDTCLDYYNHSAYYFDNKEQAIISEKNPAVTAAAEITDPETAFQIVQYNHYLLKGDMLAKKRILLHLASDLEPKRSTLNGINKAFTDDVFTLLNNLNLRHNNCDPQSKDYKQYIAQMSRETLEEWYDELYQMILLANLELDNLERKNKIAELKTYF